MRQYRLFALLVLVVLVLSGQMACKKEGPLMLPPVTDTGANTFGCQVNGRIFLPKGKFLSSFRPLWLDYQVAEDRSVTGLILRASNVNTNQQIIFRITGINLGDTLFNHYESPYTAMGINAEYYDQRRQNYRTFDHSPGIFNLTRLDLVNRIAAGTFWFDAIDTATNDTIHIREGRFDVRF